MCAYNSMAINALLSLSSTITKELIICNKITFTYHLDVSGKTTLLATIIANHPSSPKNDKVDYFMKYITLY